MPLGFIRILLAVWLLTLSGLAYAAPVDFQEFDTIYTELNGLKGKTRISTLYVKYLALKSGLYYDYKSQQEADTAAEQLKELMQELPGSGTENLFDEITNNPKLLELHRREVTLSHEGGNKMNSWVHVFTNRKGARVVREATMNTCIDYVKAFYRLLPDRWKDGTLVDEWKVVYLYSLPEFEKACPKLNAPPVAPRPFAHTILAARIDKDWYLINAEAESTEMVKVGATLPARNEEVYFPTLYKNQAPQGRTPFLMAGSVSVDSFMDGFDGTQLINISVSGSEAEYLCR